MKRILYILVAILTLYIWCCFLLDLHAGSPAGLDGIAGLAGYFWLRSAGSTI